MIYMTLGEIRLLLNIDLKVVTYRLCHRALICVDLEQYMIDIRPRVGLIWVVITYKLKTLELFPLTYC